MGVAVSTSWSCVRYCRCSDSSRYLTALGQCAHPRALKIRDSDTEVFVSVAYDSDVPLLSPARGTAVTRATGGWETFPIR